MEKRGLGRGLSALISDADSDTKAGVEQIPIAGIEPNPYQPRVVFDPEKLQDLVASIREIGILQPIMVRPAPNGRYHIIAGERRFRAAKAAGLLQVPALVKACSDREMLEMAVIENVQREDIGVMEAARAYRRMIDEFGMTQEAVAKRVGKSRPSIANTLRLLNLPQSVQLSLETGQISEGHARALLMVEDTEAMVRAMKTVTEKQLSVRETESLAREIRDRKERDQRRPLNDPDPTKSPKPSAPAAGGYNADEGAVADRLEQILQTRVNIHSHTTKGGKIEIEFYSAEDLIRIVDILLPGGFRI